jgi:hypothetical protein
MKAGPPKLLNSLWERFAKGFFVLGSFYLFAVLSSKYVWRGIKKRSKYLKNFFDKLQLILPWG